MALLITQFFLSLSEIEPGQSFQPKIKSRQKLLGFINYCISEVDFFLLINLNEVFWLS